MARPEIVVKVPVRSGDLRRVGTRVSRSQRCRSVSAAAFIRLNYTRWRLTIRAAGSRGAGEVRYSYRYGDERLNLRSDAAGIRRRCPHPQPRTGHLEDPHASQATDHGVLPGPDG